MFFLGKVCWTTWKSYLIFILTWYREVSESVVRHGNHNCLVLWGHILGSRFVHHQLLILWYILGTRRVCVLVVFVCRVVVCRRWHVFLRTYPFLLYYMCSLARLSLLSLFVVFRGLILFVGCRLMVLSALTWILIGFVLLWIWMLLGCIFRLFCSFWVLFLDWRVLLG